MIGSCLIIVLLLIPGFGLAQQIAIDRIDRMPNQPRPYQMRDWRKVTAGYDSLIFDLQRTGQYLPLSFIYTQTINYPDHPGFGIHTVVGPPDDRLYDAEAINVLPAVISASLIGIDKSQQDGYNWVLMAEEFFNRRPEENIYLNHPISSSGDDWWYETMPNVFFYQLYDRYPGTGDFEYQFQTVADRWLEALVAMGGGTAPWKVPNMHYRAWSLSTMTPNTSDVPEPEAAGAIAWLAYNAYVKTGDDRYRIGAEWAMEFLNSRSVNPSYELQLPYGVYTAARMNAELGTIYNVDKMIKWCFDVGPLRDWGVILGTWGAYDVHGLVGEVNGFNDYAFIMNTFEQVGALVPLVRYDDRFSRAIGKWTLNAANAARLFYTNYLPDRNQDSESWAYLYDPRSCIAHEALRQSSMGYSPYATGDAIAGGWGKTNLALYGSSHAGIFGGIIDTTNVRMILRLDARKTDYFQDKAYPSYLYYNPYDEEKMVDIDVGSSACDLYDAVSNSFLQRGVSDLTAFPIPADASVLLVLVPAGGTMSYDYDQLSIDGVRVDYRSGQSVSNYPPRIKSLAPASRRLVRNHETKIYCTVTDRDNFSLNFQWYCSGGTIAGVGREVVWTAPDSVGTYTFTCVVDDRRGGLDSARTTIDVVAYINQAPQLLRLVPEPKKIDRGAASTITCIARDSDDDTLRYLWSAKDGTLISLDSTATWNAPDQPGLYYVRCSLSDGRGGTAADSIGIVVLDFENIGTGIPIAFYPFEGTANDESGFAFHGTAYGAELTDDRFNNPNSAYQFDGVDDFIKIKNHPALNFRDELSVCFWIQAKGFTDNESYVISHGNWENRWKVSINPGDHRIRWTIRTTGGIRDLDSRTQIAEDVFYHVAVLYNGADVDIYINGSNDGHGTFSGQILVTSIDVTIGQVLPNNTCCNFNGVVDDVRIYTYALSDEEIQNIYQEKSPVHDQYPGQVPDHHRLHQNYPNPFNERTIVRYDTKESGRIRIEIYNLLGECVCTMVDEEKPAGSYVSAWSGKDDAGNQTASGVYFCLMRIADFQQQRKFVLLK